MHSPREILHNRMIQYSGRPSTLINMETGQNHLIAKKKSQKQYFDKVHNVKLLSQLNPNQEVLFLSPADQCSYIPSTNIDKTSTPGSYNIEAQSREIPHIHLIQQDIFTRNPTSELEPQTPHPSHIPKPSPPTRVQSWTIQGFPRAHMTKPVNSNILRSGWQQPSQSNPSPWPGIPKAMVDHLLHHLATINDHKPPRHTGPLIHSIHSNTLKTQMT